MTCDAREQMTRGIVRIDEPEAVAMELVPRWPLLGVRDEDTVADRLDPKRRIARGDFLVDEPSIRRHGSPSAVESIDARVGEVRRIQHGPGRRGRDRESFVNRARSGGIHLDLGDRPCGGSPPVDRPSFR